MGLRQWRWGGPLAVVSFWIAGCADTEPHLHYFGDAAVDVDSLAPAVSGRVMGAFIRARKPEEA